MRAPTVCWCSVGARAKSHTSLNHISMDTNILRTRYKRTRGRFFLYLGEKGWWEFSGRVRRRLRCIFVSFRFALRVDWWMHWWERTWEGRFEYIITTGEFDQKLILPFFLLNQLFFFLGKAFYTCLIWFVNQSTVLLECRLKGDLSGWPFTKVSWVFK